MQLSIHLSVLLHHADLIQALPVRFPVHTCARNRPFRALRRRITPVALPKGPRNGGKSGDLATPG